MSLLPGGLAGLPAMAMAGSFYVGGMGGLSVHRDTTFHQGERNKTRVIADYRDDGDTTSVVIGRASTPTESFRGRVELEFGEQSSTVSFMTFDNTQQADPVEEDENLDVEEGAGGNDGGETQEGERVTVTNVFGETRTTFGFVSAYGDFNLWRRVDGVLGFGLGMGKVRFEEHRAGSRGQVMNDEANAFGYHLTLGLGWRVTSFLDVEASYRQRSWEEVKLRAEDGSSSRVRVPSHNVQLGLRLLF